MNLSVPAPLKIQAYNIIKEAIISGIFRDHDPITEKLVQEKFNISRTPFREALQILESEGWVYTIQYKGTYVKPITLEDLHELFELRLIVEPGILEYVFDHNIKFNADQLEEVVNKMVTDENIQSNLDFMTLDRDFHDLLYKLIDNSRFKTVSDQVSDIMLRVGIRVLDHHSRREEVIEEHRRIISGLKDGTAKNHLRYHLEKTKEYYCTMYKESSV
ncbi:GntR family transcriptional regulator [Neobacillus cucumis]|uniref:GntR family transcriptional regulator n=1 Tax=Neobacillus cucumis TaxID=1740721 RepID=UPI00285309B8|nr:GntR family transcriptional regulator [Neobacillus cucumis]MDR4949880.1 GntR family transcriptional regulator [Neobacillus cucumis]